MARSRPAEELSVEELCRLLVEKRRSERRDRMEHYRQTGRIITLDPLPVPPTIDTMHTVDVVEGEEVVQDPTVVDKRLRRKRVFDRLLLFVEIGAVAGILLVFVILLNSLRNSTTK